MSSSGTASFAALLRLDLRRLARDLKSGTVLAVIFVSTLLGPLLAVTLTSAELLFLPVVVGWTWGADLESGSLVPLSLATSSRLKLAASRLLVLLAGSLAAISPALLDSSESTTRRTLLAGSVLAALLLGFLFVTATRSSHAGWFPFFLTLLGVFLPSLQMMRANPGFRPPLWLWLLATLLSAPWSVVISPDRFAWTPWLLFAESALVAIATAAILLRRADPLGNRS